MRKSILNLMGMMGLASMVAPEVADPHLRHYDPGKDLTYKPRPYSRRAHNNRRITRGRFTQYVPVGNGRFKAIFHTVVQ